MLTAKTQKRKLESPRIPERQAAKKPTVLEQDPGEDRTGPVVVKKKPTQQCEECYECFEDEEKLTWHVLNDHP